MKWGGGENRDRHPLIIHSQQKSIFQADNLMTFEPLGNTGFESRQLSHLSLSPQQRTLKPAVILTSRQSIKSGSALVAKLTQFGTSHMISNQGFIGTASGLQVAVRRPDQTRGIP